MLQAAQAGRASRQLYEQATTLERLVRQHLILDDPQLIEDYGAFAPGFPADVAAVAAVAARSRAARPAREARRQRKPACMLCSRRRSGRRVRRGRSPTVTRTWPKARRRCSARPIASPSARSSACSKPRRRAARPGATSALAAGLIALVLAILFAVLIARPIRQLDQAIRQMGTADFTHAIEVNGPQDMRYLGQRLEWLRSRLHELEEQQNRVSAPRLARAEDAADRGARGRRAAARPRRRRAIRRSSGRSCASCARTRCRCRS